MGTGPRLSGGQGVADTAPGRNGRWQSRLLGPRTWALGLGLAVALAAAAGPLPAADTGHDAAVAALQAAQPEVRGAAVQRLGEIGQGADADRLVPLLADPDARVRAVVTPALWQVWSRSGDAEVDAIFARGVTQLQAGDLFGAQDSFSEVIARRPDFAEGWNKRATVRYVIGDLERSLADCAEVFQRNPSHFAAMTGAAQIHARLGHPEEALALFQRALKVNPYLDGVPEAIELLQRHLGSGDPRTRT
jgi:tetratricopeptide (TPR) repeat protein